MTKPRPYMPSNGTEGDWFESQWCADCHHDDYDNDVYCALLSKAHCGDQPDEWIYRDDKPTCTAFRDASKPMPIPRCPDTLEMFPE